MNLPVESARTPVTVEPLRLAGVYSREVSASLARVWENIFDWEHLAGLHSGSFRSVELLGRGHWGWRVRLASQGAAGQAQVVEMRADLADGQYCARTLEGPGAGSEVRTRLKVLKAFRTAVEVEFHVHEHRPERLTAIGERYRELYERLWDEDEAMMILRERRLATRSRARRWAARPKVLGSLEAVWARLPMVVAFGGESFRIVELEGEMISHAVICPHWLGPLHEADVVDGCVRCPWHGYVFDIRSGRSADGHGLALSEPPKALVRRGNVVLTAGGGPRA